MNKGFTLFETIVAIGLILVGLVAALGLITTSLFYASNIQDRLIAANLAAEGIEIVRNTRDNNWLQGISWNSGLANGDYQAAYDVSDPTALPFFIPYEDTFFLLDSNTGLYNYISGIVTPYKRRISITNTENKIKIVSKVTWQRRGISYDTSVQDWLFNWK